MYHKIKDLNKEISHGFQQYELGKIISEDKYFTFKGMDMSGNVWVGKNVWVNGTTSLPAAGKVIQTTLNEIIHIEQYKKEKEHNKQTIVIICPGKYNLPSNKSEKLPNGGLKLNISVFKANNIDFEIKTLDEYLLIIAKCELDSVDDDFYYKILECLSIITGKLVNPIIVQHYHKHGNIVKIKKYNKNITNKKVHPPFRHSSSHEITSLASFFDKYLVAASEPHSELFGFWYKINRAWQADIENISLTLTVSIEGLSKKYFSQYGHPDKEISNQASEARKVIEDSELGERISQRLLANIENLNFPSPKSILYELSENAIITKKLAKTWVTLRNKSAHATVIDPDRKTFQKHIDRINQCLTLFYILLFQIIGYKGKFINYSVQNWPEHDIKPET